MIVICEECGKNYRIDDDKIKREKTQFKCKDCGHQITVRKPKKASNSAENTPTAVFTEENASETDTSGTATPRKPEDGKKQKKKKVPFGYAAPSKIRFGLTAKMFTMMIIISLVPLSMFWGVSLKQTRDRIRYEARKSSYQQFSRIVRDLDNWFYAKARIVKSLAKLEPMTSMDRAAQESVIKTIRNLHPDMNSIFTIDMNGSIFAGDARGLPSGHATFNYFKAITNGEVFAWQTILPGSSKKPVLIVASPVMRDNMLVGVLGSLITIDTISGKTLLTEIQEADFALLVKTGNRIVVHQADKNIIQTKTRQWQPMVDRLKRGKGGLQPIEDPAGRSLLTFVDTTAFGWGLAVQAEEKEALFILDQLMSFAYLLLIITVVFVFIIAWFSGRALSRPIIRLTNAADRISVGELDMEIRTNRKDEIGDLAEAIARLQDSIRLSIERLRRRR